jgi:putative DNA primase/helicase
MEKIASTPAANWGNTSNTIHSHSTIIDEFRNAMLDSIGYAPENITGDGKLHRFKDNNGKLNGAYVFHLDNRAAGYFECFKRGIKQTWKMASNFTPLSDYQRQVFKAQSQKEAEQRKIEETFKHKEAAQKACSIWSKATLAPANHPYLINKRIGIHGARLGRDNTIVIPLYNANNEIVSLQFISEAGGKSFLSGGKKKGCFYPIGEESNTILICEGFATGASLYEESGHFTVVAFDAGNLKDVAIAVRTLSPDSEIIICGDNDLSGVGQAKAIDAALTIGGKYLIPEIVGQDWNDVLSAVAL